jgi:hypothetical protein
MIQKRELVNLDPQLDISYLFIMSTAVGGQINTPTTFQDDKRIINIADFTGFPSASPLRFRWPRAS